MARAERTVAKHVSQTKGAGARPGTRYQTPRMVFALRHSAHTRTGSFTLGSEAGASGRGIARKDA